MELREVMEKESFAVVGDTLNPLKFAYKIKKAMEEKGYRVYPVGKEIKSLNDIDSDIDIIDLCINPARGLELIKECKKDFQCIVLQPGSESDELINYLKEKGLPFINGCLLVGIKEYRS